MNNTKLDNPLYMIQFWLDTRRLMQLGRMLHLPLERASNNYLVHCALSELFKDHAPKPFCVEDAHRQLAEYENKGGREIRVLGYSTVDKDKLQDTARSAASPAVYEICDWERTASKPMPDSFSEGTELGFELRACPVVIKSSAGHTWREGQELDAFLSRVYEIDDESVDIDREQTYADWLRRQLDERGGAKVETVGMKRFSIERMSRRIHADNRKLKLIKRPDATLTGTLTVKEDEKFMNLLRSGIGKHKSFGYGMLKVRKT